MRPLFHADDQAYLLVPVMTDYSLYPRRSRQGGHIHNVYHVVLTLEGRGVLHHDSGRVPMAPGDLLLINPGATHVFETFGEVVRVFAFNFYLVNGHHVEQLGSGDIHGKLDWLEAHAETRPLQNLFGLMVQGCHVVYDREGPVWARAVELVTRLHDTVGDYLNITDREQRRDGHEAYSYQASLFMLQLMAVLVPERLVPATDRRLHEDPILRQVDEYLRQHIDEKYELGTMARTLGYAPTYLCAHFSRRAGITIGAYHNRLRVLSACSRLKAQRRSITQVGLELGYSSPQHFSAAFRRVKNMSPREYRRLGEV